MNIASSSIRLEDGVLSLLALVTATHWTRSQRKQMGPTGIAIVVLAALAACTVGVLASRLSPGAGILYALRPLEYWFVLPCVVILLEGRDFNARMMWITSLLQWVTLAQVGVSALQYLGGISIGFSKFSYERGAGLAAGPYELGALCALLACFWFDRRRYGLFLTSLAGIVMSQSRISMAAIVISIALLIAIRVRTQERPIYLPNARSKSAYAIPTMAVTLGVTGLILFWPQISDSLLAPALDRVGSTSLLAAWSHAGVLAQNIAPVNSAVEYTQIAYGAIADLLSGNNTGDASNIVRFYRWHILLNSMSFPRDLLLGLGPSFAGPSVDGAFLRIFVESGIVGALAWLTMFTKWIRSTPAWFGAAGLSLLIGSIFIDLPFALRPMVLLWILFAVAKVQARNDELNTIPDRTPTNTTTEGITR